MEKYESVEGDKLYNRTEIKGLIDELKGCKDKVKEYDDKFWKDEKNSKY